MSGSADCYAATGDRPDGQAPRDRLVLVTKPSHRSASSTQTNNRSLVFGELEATNSLPNGLGRLFGYSAQFPDSRRG